MSQDRTILLIDHDPRSIHGLVGALGGAGYRVEVRNDGESGLEAFHELTPDLVLIEPMVPKKHGFQVCREIKKDARGRETPVIIVTGFYRGQKHRLDAHKNYLCDDYLEKPVADAELLERCLALMPVRVSAGAGTHAGETLPQPGVTPRPLHDLSDAEIEASLDDFAFEALGSEPVPLPGVSIDHRDAPALEFDSSDTGTMPQSAPLESIGETEPDPTRDRSEIDIVSTSVPHKSRWPLWFALAAALCLLVGAAILWSIRDSPAGSAADPSSPVAPATTSSIPVSAAVIL